MNEETSIIHVFPYANWSVFPQRQALFLWPNQLPNYLLLLKIQGDTSILWNHHGVTNLDPKNFIFQGTIPTWAPGKIPYYKPYIVDIYGL